MQIYNIKVDKNKKEITNHGVYEFPIQIYETFLEKNVLGFVNWHWHEEVQFCLITDGRVDFYVSEKKYTLDKGQGIFIIVVICIWQNRLKKKAIRIYV